MTKIRHVLGISGGKDSTALAVYLKENFPQIDIEYYFCDTGEELPETYEVIEKLQSYLGKEIIKLHSTTGDKETPFQYFLDIYKGYLPSANARWCTKKMKLEPFEKFVGDDLVISYVGIREDENREGYISKKQNIQSIFPFRRNIWSQDVINKVLSNENIVKIVKIAESQDIQSKNQFIDILKQEITPVKLTMQNKLNLLLSINITSFNRIVHEFLKETEYPIGLLKEYSLLQKEDFLTLDDVYKLLEVTGVGKPPYYKPIKFEVDNGREKLEGYYNRSRSGCYFCFFQQKIEWIWLLETHPELYEKAKEFEKSGFTWNEGESLEELAKPERVKEIKIKHIEKMKKNSTNCKSGSLLSILEPNMGNSCPACFL